MKSIQGTEIGCFFSFLRLKAHWQSDRQVARGQVREGTTDKVIDKDRNEKLDREYDG